MTNKPTMAPVQPNTSSQPNAAAPVSTTIVPPAAGDIKLAAKPMDGKTADGPAKPAEAATAAPSVAVPADKPKL